MDKAIDQTIKKISGDSVMVTAWIVVAAIADGASTGAHIGFTMVNSEGMPNFAKLGLLESAIQSLNNENMFMAWEDRKQGPLPPF